MSINAGSVSVDVVPDATGFAEKLRAKLGNLAVQVLAELDDKEAEAKLAELARGRDTTVNADADTTAAEAELDNVARDRTAKVDVDTAGAERNISNLTAAIVGLGPALVPVTAAAGGLALALGAPVAASGGGLTIFGLLAGKAISDTVKLEKQIDQLRQKAATLTDPKARAAALAQAKALEQSLTGPQKAFLGALGQVKDAYNDLVKAEGPALFEPFTHGLHDLAQLLPTTAPLLHNMGSALDDIENDLARSARSGSLHSFLDFVTEASGPDTRALGHILGNIASGLMGITEASQPLGGSVLGGLDRMTGRFAKWGQSAGTNNFQDFLRYVDHEGPHVVKLLGDTAGAFGAIARDAAPIGGKIIDGLDAFANILHRIADSKAGPTLITAAAGFVAVNKAVGLAGKLGGSSLLGGGVRGSLGRVAAGTVGRGVVPVYVTNPGFGGGAGKGIGAAEGAAAGAAARGGVGAGEKFAGEAALAKLLRGGFLRNLAVGSFALGDAGHEVLPAPKQVGGYNLKWLLNHQDIIKTTNALNALGVSQKMVTEAAHGNAKAQAEVDTALGKARDKVKELQDAQRKDFANKDKYTAYQHQIDDLTDSYNTVKGAVDKATAAYGRSTREVVASKQRLAEYTVALRSLPKKVQTLVQTPGAIDSMADVKKLQRQYDLTPKQVRTLMQLAGVDQAAQKARQFAAQMAALNGHVYTTYLKQVTQHVIAGGGHPVEPRASGGLVAAGRQYLVGEQGPEMFVSRVPGRIIPAMQTAKMMSAAPTRVIRAESAPAMTPTPSGPLVAHFYGADHVLMGTMRGEIAQDRSYAAARARQRVGA